MHKKILTTSLAMALTVPVWLTAAFPDGGQVAEAATKKPTKKAKAVINKIKAINSKKTNYIAKTRAANNAYKKLSTTDKKLVSNYSTLKKHVAKIAPLEKKITTLKSQVNSITTKNYVTQAAKAQKTYDGLNKITQAAVPVATVKKLEKYAAPAQAKASYKRVVTLLSLVETPDPSTPGDSETTLVTISKDGMILDEFGDVDKTYTSNKTLAAKQLQSFLADYKKMDDFQKSLFNDDENELINKYLKDEDLINRSVDLAKAYEALNPANSNFNTKSFELMQKYYDFVEAYPNNTADRNLYLDPNYVAALDTIYGKYIALYQKLASYNKALEALEDTPNVTIATIKAAEDAYKASTKLDQGIQLSKYLDKDLVKLYEAYKAVPEVLRALNRAEAYDSIAWSTAANVAVADQKNIQLEKHRTTIVEAQKLYDKLGDDQKKFVDALHANNIAMTYPATYPPGTVPYEFSNEANEAKILKNRSFFPEEQQIKDAEKLDKTYTKAVDKNDLQALIDSSVAFGKALPEVKKYTIFGKEMASVQETYKDQIADINKFKEQVALLNQGKTATITVPDANKPNELKIDNKKDIITASDVDVALEALRSAYKTLEAKKAANPGKPAAMDMLPKELVKDYELYMTMPQLIREGQTLSDELVKKPYQPGTAELKVEEKDFKYNTGDEERIVAFGKAYNALTEPQRLLVDKAVIMDQANRNDNEKTPIARIWGTEYTLVANAIKIDAAILKLDTGSKSFAADVKKVYNQYKSASPKVKKYVINQERLHWFNGLVSKTSGNYPQAIANKFTELVGKLNTKSAVDTATNGATPVITAVDYYHTMIEHDTSTQSIIEKSVMKKYESYVEAYEVVNLLAATDIEHPTTQDIKNIQDAIKIYDKMSVGPKNAVMNSFKPVGGAETPQAKVLGKVDEIKTATEIDKAYQKLKPSSATYQVDMIKLYTTFINASPTVRKYVAAAEDLKVIETTYKKEYEAALAFIAEIDKITGASNIGEVNDLKDYYEKNVQKSEIIQAFVPKGKMTEYNKLMVLIQIQDVARYQHFYKYWCSTDDILSYDYLYVDLSHADLLKVLKAYNTLDTEQKGIIASSKHRTDSETTTSCYLPDKQQEREVMRDTSFLASAAFLDEASKIDKMYEALKPSSKDYLEKVMELIKTYDEAEPATKAFVKHADDIEALKEKYKTEIQDLANFEKAVKDLSVDSKIMNTGGATAYAEQTVQSVYNRYNRLSDYVQSVVADDIMKKYEQFVLLLDFSVPTLRDANDVAVIERTVTTSAVTTKKVTYTLKAERLNQQTVPQDKVFALGVANDVLTVVAPAKPTGAIIGTPYTLAEMEDLKNAVTAYGKLGNVQKTMVKNLETTATTDFEKSLKILPFYVDQKKYIDEAQKMEDLYAKFVTQYTDIPYGDDPSDPRPPLVDKEAKKYAEALKALVFAYDGLSNNARWYLRSADKMMEQKRYFEKLYSGTKLSGDVLTPATAVNVQEFEKAVAALSSKSTLDAVNPNVVNLDDITDDISNVVAMYNKLSDYQKAWLDSKVLARYNEFLPLIAIRENLYKLPSFDGTKELTALNDEQAAILSETLKLHKALKGDAKTIFDNTSLPNKEYLSDEYNIAQAEAVDKVIDSVKEGSSFFKQFVKAQKAYDALTKQQQEYVKNRKMLTKYYKKVDKVQYKYDFNGKAPISFKNKSNSPNKLSTYNPYEMIIMLEELVLYLDENQASKKEEYLKDAIDMANIRNGLNKSVKINGISLKPLNAADTKAQTRYHYYYKVFDMKNQLKNFKEVFPK
ncbi:hypothetical protein [Kurthia sp. Dielmo]|uniref:hypothetical protein n=1 Tax=Kurthia sp. Dielmo TaxID=1033738 RepID=UPI0002FA2716|nr:hypothetical protein [Kurthia sp. Dielmo]